MSLLGLGGHWGKIYTGRCGDCDNCSFASGCPYSAPTIKHGKIPDDCFEHNCSRCPRMFDGSCSYIMGDDVPLKKNTWFPPPPPSVECCQRCGTCWQAPTCTALKEYLEFAKEITPYDDFKKICAAEDRTNKNFRNCMCCKEILTCSILKRVRSR